MVKVTGKREHEARLRRLRGPRLARALNVEVFGEAQTIQTDAQLSISTGSISGKNHVPSAPGEPPNQDTGVLAGNIEAESTGPLKAEVSSNAPYAAALENGTENMAARPYMLPQAKKSRKRFPRRLAAVVREVSRRVG